MENNEMKQKLDEIFKNAHSDNLFLKEILQDFIEKYTPEEKVYKINIRELEVEEEITLMNFEILKVFNGALINLGIKAKSVGLTGTSFLNVVCV